MINVEEKPDEGKKEIKGEQRQEMSPYVVG